VRKNRQRGGGKGGEQSGESYAPAQPKMNNQEERQREKQKELRGIAKKIPGLEKMKMHMFTKTVKEKIEEKIPGKKKTNKNTPPKKNTTERYRNTRLSYQEGKKERELGWLGNPGRIRGDAIHER